MWHPFKKFHLDRSKLVNSTNDTYEINPEIKKETEIAQLRSLKARTEIKMIYENLSEQALNKIKGQRHASYQ